MILKFLNRTSSEDHLAAQCQLNVDKHGLLVYGPDNVIETGAIPKTLDAGLWLHRAQLADAGLAQPLDVHNNELEAFEPESCAAIRVPFDSLVFLKDGFAPELLHKEGDEVFDPVLSDLLPDISDFTLKIESNLGVLVSDRLQLELSFWHSGQQVVPDRYGPWLDVFGHNTLLNHTQWHLCQIAEQFNTLENKNANENFAALANLYEVLGHEPHSNVSLESVLGDTLVLAPARLTLGWSNDSDIDDATKSAYPVFMNLPDDLQENSDAFETAFREEFFKSETAEPVYSLSPQALGKNSSDKHIRILLSSELQDAVTHIRQSMRGLRETDAQTIALDPDKEFEDVCSPEVLAFDLSTYGPRVIGLGPLVFKPNVKVRTLDQVCLLDEGWDALSEESSNKSTTVEIEAQTGDGNPINLSFSTDTETLEKTATKIQTALQNNQSTVTITDSNGMQATLKPDAALADQLFKAAVAKKVGAAKEGSSNTKPKTSGSHSNHLKALSNEEQQLYEELTKYAHDERTMFERFERPQSLVETLPDGNKLELGIYQQEGVAWLQTVFLSGKPGVLLADDMGLGKTLQVLTFLAWLIESGWETASSVTLSGTWSTQLKQDKLQPGQQFIVNPHPILVVIPKILMDNWKSEIEKFFKDDGDIFASAAFLDASSIKSYKLPGRKSGNDFKSGSASLDINQLKSNRLVVADYPTVKNHYFSFARVPWSCLVMDECQAIKNPGTALTHALSCIASNTRFKIAMTGTPIENDLMDLWSLFDVAAPGILGSAKEFKQNYFKEDSNISSHGWDITALKSTLGCPGEVKVPQSSSFVLGRNKKDFLGNELPELWDISEKLDLNIGTQPIAPDSISCRFLYSDAEWKQQQKILENIAKESKRGRALKAVQYIKLFSEHPWLAAKDEQPPDRKYDTASLLASSSKFRWLQEALDRVKAQNEKVLIFTRSIQMQTWIYHLLKDRYGVDFEPINGNISGKKKAGEYRTKLILDRFEAHPDFAGLVLSPEVAGMGLNITAANHVIHYGRWWNPAKEDQATCRAYRKGQKNTVYLYVPIGLGPNREESFDQRLDQLLRSKSAMRQDFLTPMGADLSEEEQSKLIPGLQKTVSPQLEGHDFEKTVAEWMKSNGYKDVQVTPGSNDWGADVIGIKDNQFVLVQCKRQLTGSKDICDQVNQARDFYGTDIRYQNYSAERRMVGVVASLYEVDVTTRTYYENKGIQVWAYDW